MFGNDVVLGVKPRTDEFDGFSGWACCASRHNGAALSTARHKTAARRHGLVGFIVLLLLADFDTRAILQVQVRSTQTLDAEFQGKFTTRFVLVNLTPGIT